MGSHYSLNWTTGLDYWTGLLDWTTGLDYLTCPKWCKMPFQAFFSVGEKLIMFIQPTSLLNLLPVPVEPTLLESVEVKGHMHIYYASMKRLEGQLF